MANTDYQKLSSTAMPVAYGRSFSDIPYSREIAELCRTDSLSKVYRKNNRIIAPYIEARFKALTNLLVGSGIKNIIEIAAGLSQRGLIMVEDASINYFETDLPDMIRQTEIMLKKILDQEHKILSSNLRFAALDALDEENFKDVISRFPPGPVAIGHEGLIVYFTRDEKTRFAHSVKRFLSERGGVWITPDIYTAEQLHNLMALGEGGKVTEDVVKNTGRNYHDTAFADIEDAKDFFHNLGFAYTIRTLGDAAGNIASSHGLDEDTIKTQLALNIWELSLL